MEITNWPSNTALNIKIGITSGSVKDHDIESRHWVNSLSYVIIMLATRTRSL